MPESLPFQSSRWVSEPILNVVSGLIARFSHPINMVGLCAGLCSELYICLMVGVPVEHVWIAERNPILREFIEKVFKDRIPKLRLFFFAKPYQRSREHAAGSAHCLAPSVVGHPLSAIHLLAKRDFQLHSGLVASVVLMHIRREWLRHRQPRRSFRIAGPCHRGVRECVRDVVQNPS